MKPNAPDRLSGGVKAGGKPENGARLALLAFARLKYSTGRNRRTHKAQNGGQRNSNVPYGIIVDQQADQLSSRARTIWLKQHRQRRNFAFSLSRISHWVLSRMQLNWRADPAPVATLPHVNASTPVSAGSVIRRARFQFIIMKVDAFSV